MGAGKTEWEDILIEKGIIAPPPPPQDQAEDVVYDIASKSNFDASDSTDELLDDDFMATYRHKRYAELARQQQAQQFGEIVEISRSDFVQDVTEASHRHPVMLFLYQGSMIPCQQLAKWLRDQAAPNNASVKFVQMVATRCIENYPDANLPTVLLYRKGNVQRQLLRTDPHQVQQLIDQVHEAERGE